MEGVAELQVPLKVELKVGAELGRLTPEEPGSRMNRFKAEFLRLDLRLTD